MTAFPLRLILPFFLAGIALSARAQCTLEATVDFLLPATCPGAANGAVNVVTTGGQGTVIFYDEGVGLPYGNGNLTFYTAGPHFIVAQDAAGCRDTVFFTITEPAPFVFQIFTTPVICFGGNTGTGTVSVTGGTGTTTFQWQPITGGTITSGSSVVNLTAGNYFITVTDQSGCKDTTTANVPTNPAFAFTTAQDSVNCFGGSDGSATVTVSGGVPPYQYLWANSSTTNTATNLPAGFHAVTITDNVNCQAVTLVQVLQPALFVLDSVRSVPLTCFGTNNGIATAFPRGGKAPYSYQWSGSSQTGKTITGLAPGTYTVTVSDANGCTVTGQTTVSGPTELLLNATVSNITCSGNCNGSITLAISGATPPYLIDWDDPGVPDGQPNATNLCAGDYMVVVTDSKGCSKTQKFTIAPATQIDIQFSGQNPTCATSNNGAIVATVTGGSGQYTYSWSDGSNGATASGLTCGVFTLVVSDGNGCTSSASTTLICPDPIKLDSIRVTPVRCAGQTNGSIAIYPSGGTGGFTFMWNDPMLQMTGTAVNLAAGPYSVIVRDANGCSITAAAAVGTPPALTASISTTPARCVGEASGTATVNVLGGTPFYTYFWNTSATTNQITGLVATIYDVTVSDANGCTFVPPTATITQPATPLSLVLTQTAKACFGDDNGSATALATGSNGAPYSYKWSSGQTGSPVTNLAAGNYVVTATDVNGCTTTGIIDITQSEQISVNTATIKPTCFGYSDGQVAVNMVSGGNGNGNINNYTYQWSIVGAPDGPYIGIVPGDTPFTLTVTDMQGCSNVINLSIQQPRQIELILNLKSVSCKDGADGSIEIITAIADNPISTYQWNVPGGNTQQLTGLVAGDYTVTATDTKGCSGEITATVSEPDSLKVTFDATPLACNGDSIGVAMAMPSGGTPSYVYAWSNGGSTPSIDQLTAGTYTLTLTDANGCTTTGAAILAQPNPVSIQTDIYHVDCFGGENGRIVVNVNGGVKPYRYSIDGSPLNNEPVFFGLAAGEYDVAIQDGNGCVERKVYTVLQPDAITVDLGADLSVVYGDSLILTATVENAVGLLRYLWTPELAEPIRCVDSSDCVSVWLKPQNTNRYNLQVIDENGCSGKDVMSITVEKPRDIYVPTGFTPNGDGANDLLNVFGKTRQVKNVIEFEVYDRWGELVYRDLNFQVSDIARGWDGSFKGQECPSGVYIWQISVEYNDGVKADYHGQTTLIR